MIEKLFQLVSLAFGSGVVTWSSKKQAVTTLSSSQAEYVAATSVACQAIWLRRILVDLHQKQDDATTIFVTIRQQLQ